jgi:hypothetical protein
VEFGSEFGYLNKALARPRCFIYNCRAYNTTNYNKNKNLPTGDPSNYTNNKQKHKKMKMTKNANWTQ